MKTYYIVTGRIPYDDEDSIFVVEADTIDEADAEFRRLILEINNGQSTEEDADGQQCVYVNSYVRCEYGKKPEVQA